MVAVLVTATGVGSTGSLADRATRGNPADARAHAERMVKAARSMVDHGKEGRLLALADEALQVIAHGKGAMDAVPFPGNRHARDAMAELTEAVDQAANARSHAEQGHQDVATSHAKKSLSHARRGLSHARAL